MKKRLLATILLFCILTGTCGIAFARNLSATVNTKNDPLNLWNAPDGSTCLVRIPKGETISILEKGDKWSKAEYDGKTGYVRTEYLLFSENPPTANTEISSVTNEEVSETSEKTKILSEEYMGTVFTYFVSSHRITSRDIRETANISKIEPSGSIVSFPATLGGYPTRISEHADEAYEYNRECCINISEYRIAENNDFLVAIDGVLFQRDSEKDVDKYSLIAYPPEKADAQYTVPLIASSIGKNAFQGAKHIEEVDASNVRHIGPEAFADCQKLRQLDVSATAFLGRNILEGCSEEIKNGKTVDYATDEQMKALANAAITIIKSTLKNPNSIQINSISTSLSKTFYSWWLVLKIDYSAMNSFGGYERDTAFFRTTNPHSQPEETTYEAVTTFTTDKLELQFQPLDMN